MNATERLTLNDQGMAFDPVTGASYLVSPTGMAIIVRWRQGLDDAAIADALAAEYDVDAGFLHRDIADFRTQLRTCGLVD